MRKASVKGKKEKSKKRIELAGKERTKEGKQWKERRRTVRDWKRKSKKKKTGKRKASR